MLEAEGARHEQLGRVASLVTRRTDDRSVVQMPGFVKNSNVGIILDGWMDGSNLVLGHFSLIGYAARALTRRGDLGSSCLRLNNR